MKQVFNCIILCIATMMWNSIYAKDFLFTGDTSHPIVEFVFCSDVHFGLTKANFRGMENISSADVNAAMVAQMNLLPKMSLPNDGGAAAGKNIGAIDAVVITGDICNRMENGVQSAAASWSQFKADYVGKLHLLNKKGQKAPLLLTTGNHDISDGIGFEKPMVPLVDKSSLVGIYNMMMQPTVPKTNLSYNRTTDKIHYSRNFGHIHFMFVDAWPDSAERKWMESDLKTVPKNTPVLLFAHSMPDVEARFFKNPNADHSVNMNDRFENLVTETFKDGKAVTDSAVIEQKSLEVFLQAHPNIKAYFHGHNNYTEFYDWNGPDKAINLHCFRVDSPMKGKYSAKDETKLSFEIITIDPSTKILTARECLWNTHPLDKSQKIEWGATKTIAL